MKKQSLKRMLESAESGVLLPEPKHKSVPTSVDILNLPERLESSAIDTILENVPDLKEISTEADVKSAVIELEKSRRLNSQLREEFVMQPSMFLESEIDLDDKIKRFHQVALAPGLFSSFTSTGAHTRLLQLLEHPNEDIGIEVLRVFGDLTDESVLEQVEDPDSFLVEITKAGDAPVHITNFISRFLQIPDCSHDGALVCLETIGNLIQGYPDSHSSFLNAGLVDTLLAELIEPKSADITWGYCVSYSLELIIDLIQSEGTAHVSQKALKIILNDLSLLVDRPIAKSSVVEAEMRENLSDLVLLLMENPDSRSSILDQNGMLIFIELFRSNAREKILTGLRLCSLAVTGNSHACNLFIDKLGLRILGSILTNKLTLTKDIHQQNTIYEYMLSLVYSLLVETNGERLHRVVSKLTEHDLDKSLPILHTIASLLAVIGGAWAANNQTTREAYLERCEKGLFRLQRASLVILLLYGRMAEMGGYLRTQLVQEMTTLGINLQDFIQIIFEYMQMINQNDSQHELFIIQSSLEQFQSDAI